MFISNCKKNSYNCKYISSIITNIIVSIYILKNNDKYKKYIQRGQRNTRYHEKILSNKNKFYNFINFL